MNVEFRTIAIGHLVLKYLIIAGLLLLAQLLFPTGISIWFLFLGPVVLYFLCRGMVKLEIKGAKLLIDWTKPPIIGYKPRREIDLNEIIRWKYERNLRGPDNFVLILEDGERLQIRPDMFSMRDLETELFKTFSNQMRAHHAATPEKQLQDLIAHSGYLKDLNWKLRILGYSLQAAIALGLISVIMLIFVKDQLQFLVSGAFVVFFVISLFVFLYSKYYEKEKEQTLRADFRDL